MALTLEQARQNALNRRKSITPQTAQQNITAEENKPENTGGLLGGVGYTLGRVGLGALRGLEGIWDFAAGGIADLFGADEWAYEQATESPFDDLTTELDAWYNPSEFMQFVGDVGAGVGQMLPSVAAAAIPGAGPALSTAMFTTSAAGMGVSDAAKTTGELGAKEWLYGGASGAVEGAIEKLSGGIGGTKLGTVLGKQVAKSTGGKLAATFVGEGLEEVASDLIDPALRRVTGVDPDATVDVSQLPNTFLVGGTAGAILGGGSRLVNAKRAGGFNNLNAMEDANAIREARARGNTLQAEGRLTDSWADTLSKSEQEAAKRLSTRLQRMNADTRSQFIARNNLGDMFDADGALVENTVTGPQEYNRDAVSYSARNLVGRADANGNSVLKYAPTKNAVREDIAQAAKDIAKLSNGDSRYVVVDTLTVPESGQKANAFYDNETGIMYIANDADMGDTRSFVVSHEYVHSLEGSGQYSKYANEVLAEIAQSPEYRKKYNYDEYYARYKQAHPNVQEETLNYIVETEMVADFTAKEILTNESAIRRLANRDASLVRRIYEWVKEKIRRLTSGGGNRENVAYLRRAEKLLAKAIDEPGGGISISEMDEYVREENARRNEREADAEAETAETGEARRLADVRMSVQNVDKIKGTSTARAAGTATGSNSASDGDVSTNSVRDNAKNVKRNGQNSDKNKRYSLTIDGETVSGTVEETNDLVALHNLTEENLLKVLDLGGFPMPSIAVTKADIPFTDFGDITVVFGKETIDPAKPENAVYSRDAWTPTVPQAEYEINETKAREIIDRLLPYVNEFGDIGGIRKRLTVDELQELANNRDGNIVDEFAGSIETKYAYLREIGAINKDYTDMVPAYSERLRGKINSEISARNKEYKAWIDELFNGIIAKKGIRTRTDRFTSSGASRSFDETHIDYTLENIVKFMRSSPTQSAETTYASTHTLAAALAKNFSSIEDIKSAKAMLSAKAESEIAEARNRYESSISEIIDSMAGRNIELQEGAEEVLLELARSHRTTPTSILGYLEKEYRDFYNFNAGTAQKISTLFNALAAMKTDMFEAKPRRAVGLNEIKRVLIPSRHPNQRLLEALTEKNIPYTLYERSIDKGIDERADILQRLDGVRFSLPETDSQGSKLSAEQREFFKDSKVVDDSGRLRVTYHGSPNSFYTFDRGRIGKGNDQFGAGFYFATSEETSRSYGDNVHKTYLNITKPIIINRTADGGDLFDVKITQKQAYEILKRHPLIYDPESSPLGDMFEEYWEVGAKDYMIREAAKNFNSIGLLDSDYLAYRNYPNELHEAIRDVLGYDGVEVRFDNTGDRFYVAWFENQIKQTSNKNPTGSADIRYSISQNQNTRDENYINNKLKTYTYADVESIVDNLTINKYGDDVVLRGKKNVGKQIYTLLNETPIRNRRAKAEQIARQIVYQNLAAQSLYNAEEIENARKDGIEISETWIDKKLSSQLSETENESLVKEIRDELLDSFETAGKLNATGKMYLRYKEVGDRLSKLLVKDSILKTARRMKKRNYPKAFEAFDGIRKILAKLEMRSDINEKSGRDIIKAFGEFYTASNEALQGYYSEEVRQAIDDFISYNGEGNLDLYELEQIDTILNAADHLLKEYDKAFLNGRTVSVTKTSNNAVNTVKENADLYKATVLGAMRLKGYVGSFFRSIVDTRTLAMWLDGGNKGIITELFEDIAKASTRQTITVMDLYDDFDKFIKKNKKFYKSLEQKVTFKFNGKDVEITRGEAISLYLTSLQEDGLYHLAFGGFAVGKDQNNIRRYVGQKPFYGKPEDIEQYESEVMQQAKKEFSALYDTFTETEKEYIRLARDLFNNKAKRIKQEIDIKRIGMTNANVENYFPERVYEVGRPLKQGNTYIQEMNLIANQSIHKDRVKGSKQTLYISPVNMVVMNHIRQIAMYNAYAIPIDTLRRVMNKNVSLTFDGKPNTAQAEMLKTVIQETAWADFEKFLDKYMMDVQGGSFSNTTPDKIIRWMRSNYAKFQLGLNIKTMLSQLTSLPMAGSRLGWKNLLKGTFAKPNFEEMLKYSEWARARNYEGAAYKSQSLVDNVDKVGQLAMKPIGMVDLFTMNRIYNAAKYYIASRDGVSLDSVECKTKAAAMLEEIGRETQNNSEAAEKSSLMRSGNELIKSIVMFSSDAMKQFSTLIQSLNKIKFIKQKIKLGKGDKVALEKQLSAARKEARGAFASVGVSSAMYVLMGMLVNYGLFAKEPEDDESYIEIFLKNFGGSVTGMIPVVRDLYSFFVEGYELDNFAYETVNGLSEAVKNIGTLMERAGSGERVSEQEWMLAMRKFIYAAGQITGIPTRNLYNQIYGLIKRVSPSAAYDINSMFYGASTKDLDKAIEKGDTALSTTIAEQLLSDKGIDASREVASAFSDLYSKGYSMPKGIPESITYNEEEISLNAKQQGIVIDAYSEAANKAEGLINSADWASLSDDAKANALKLLFNYYYYYGINKATGAYADNRTLLLGSAIDITKIASAYGKIAELTADTDKKGNVISGTKKAKVQRLVNSLRLSAAQKYILMGFLGYKNSNGESSVTSYIRNIGISQDMQTALFEMSGYEVS